MDKLKELIKKIRIVDFIIVACVIVALLVGFVTYKGYRQTADKQIEATSDIIFKVYMRGVTLKLTSASSNDSLTSLNISSMSDSCSLPRPVIFFIAFCNLSLKESKAILSLLHNI